MATCFFNSLFLSLREWKAPLNGHMHHINFVRHVLTIVRMINLHMAFYFYLNKC